MDNRPIVNATSAFRATLTDAQRTSAQISFDAWSIDNRVADSQQFGITIQELSDNQRSALHDLLSASLSPSGLAKVLARIGLSTTTVDAVKHADDCYRIALVGAPSLTEDWGWHLSGPDLDLPCLLRSQTMSITPFLISATPIIEADGTDGETDALAMVSERDKAMAFVVALTDEQRSVAQIQPNTASGNESGIVASDLSDDQRGLLLDLIAEYVQMMRSDHATSTLAKVAAHLDQTTFAWIDDASDEPIFYYRIQSPVIAIEFDYQEPGPLGHASNFHQSAPGPQRAHIHAVIRTPGDRDRDLLGTHYATSPDHQGTPSAATAAASGSLVIGGQLVRRPPQVNQTQKMPKGSPANEATMRTNRITTLERGLAEVTGWRVMRDLTSQWVDLVCPSEETAIWLWYAIATENVDVRQHHNLLFFPTAPVVSSRDSIAQVLNAVATSHRCWAEHQRFTRHSSAITPISIVA